MRPDQIVAADLTYLNGRFERGIRILIEGGRIAGLDRQARPTLRLEGQAILPGFVNTHSHAFQRGLRGAGETYPQGAGSFWTWRSEMYDLATSVTDDRLFDLSSLAFREMLRAGITTVAEFHYLHHAGDSADYAFDDVILRAAETVGIRLVLLNTCYFGSAPGQPLNESQRRFETPSLEGFWRQMDRLTGRLNAGSQTLGVAAHSLRAVDIDNLTALHDEARARGLPFHMHLEEQRLEIEQCLDHYGRNPAALVNSELELSSRFTAVHCTHTAPVDLLGLSSAGSHVCICPTTEGNLGDGIPDLSPLDDTGCLCLGTDSNNRISMLEEMRWLEYGQRLAHGNRGALATEERIAPALINAATINGAAALGLNTGTIEPGAQADFVTIDLENPSLKEVDQHNLQAALVFGCDDEAILRTSVGGQWQLHRTPGRKVTAG